MDQAIEILFKLNATTLHGKVTTIEKNNEFFYTLNLHGTPPFTIHLSDDGYWECDNTLIDPILVALAGDTIENLEDFADVLTELDPLRSN